MLRVTCLVALAACTNATCYRRKDVNLPKCNTGAAVVLATFTRGQQHGAWVEHSNTNCFGGGNGASTVLPEPFSTTATLEQCQTACETDPECTAIVYPQPNPCNPAALEFGGSKRHPGSLTTQIKGPAKVDDASVKAWLAEMNAFRPLCQQSFGYNNGTAFEVPGLEWTQTSYISPQMHPYDRFFFDPSLGNGTNGSGYTVDKWLADLNTRYGGIDKALIWPTYTNIGIDDRNTFDLIRSMPGGAEGIKVVVDQLHARGVKVLWPYHPWDHSTKGQEKNNVTDFQAMAELLRDTNSDGFNGDTMRHIPKAFYDAAMAIHRPIALEAEGGPQNPYDLNYVTVGWAEGWTADEPGAVNNIPPVDKPKWLSNGKVMENWCDRWSGNPSPQGVKSKISELQVSWFNGLGYESWENVWGTWNGINDRDGEALRRIGIMLRYFGRRGFLQSSEWAPHTVDVRTMAQGVFGSLFPSPDGSEAVYTLVNRMATPLKAGHVKVAGRTAGAGYRYYDCYNGVELKAADDTLTFEIEANGFGCVVATRNSTGSAALSISITNSTSTSTVPEQLRGEAPVQPATLGDLLQAMKGLTSKPLSSFSPDFHYLQQRMVDYPKTPLRKKHTAGAGEVFVPGSKYNFVAKGIEIEGGKNSGVDVQYPWETFPQRAHSQQVTIGAMYVDKFPVTNAQYADYLKASKYAPSDTANWLKQNFEGGAPKAGWEGKPVTYVSLDDARQYCAYNKKRLPHVFEWQYIAQGNDGRQYPWGNTDNASLTPAVNNDYENPGPEPVGRHPDGASPFGVQDLVRSVWQYTSEFQDIHTRSVVLRGGSNYGPWRGGECRWIENNDGTPRTDAPGCFQQAMDTPVPGSTPHPMGGSMWYFPPAFELNTYNKYYLMSGSYERAGTIGFRCVADVDDKDGVQRGWPVV